MKKNIVLFLFVIVGFNKLQATESDSIKGKGIVILPMFYYTPETRIALGVGGLRNFFLGDTSRRDKQFSSFYKGKMLYTQNDQYVIDFGTNLYTKENKFHLQQAFEFKRYPLNFFGIGNTIDPEISEKYDAKVLTFNTKTVRRIKGKYYLGFQNQFKYFYNVVPGDLGILNASIPGYKGGITSGIGFILRYDSRDNANSCYKGVFYNVELVHFHKFYFSDFNFIQNVVDLRKYWQKKVKWVFAAQYFHNFNFGNVPFYKMALLGGDLRMRGYYAGMYRDNFFASTQFEARRWLTKSISFVSFVGLGGISSQINMIPEGLKLSYGVGMRLFVKGTDRLSIRVDYGRTLEAGVSGTYVTVGEAF